VQGVRRSAIHGWALAFVAAFASIATACGGAGGADLEQRLAALVQRQDEGKAAETLGELTELAEQHPDNPELNFRLGIAMIAAGRPTEAVFPLHKAAESDEYAVPAGIVLASTLAQTTNHAEALRTADRVLERDPENEAAMLIRASSAVELHDGTTALESADRLIEKAPDNHSYRFVRAAALGEAGRLDEAEALHRELLDSDWGDDPQAKTKACFSYTRFLRDVRKETERAVALIKECVEKNPDDVSIITALGGFLEELERREDLIEILEGVIERHPDARPLREALVTQLVHVDRLADAKKLSEEWAAEADDSPSWRQVANIRRRTGDVAGALEALDKAIALAATPEEELRFFRAELLIELGRTEDAEKQLVGVENQLYRDVLEGRMAQERGDLPGALELYGRASIDWPQNHGLRVLAARAAFLNGDTERAKSDLLEATRQAPKDSDAALWLAHIYFSEGNFRQCLAFAKRHRKERGVLDPGAHLLMAEAFAASNRMPQALKTLEELSTVRDGEFRVVAWSAAARMRARSKPAEALQELERKVSEARLDLGDPGNITALNQLFDLQLQTGQVDAAKKRVDALLAKRPDSAHLHGLRGRLALLQGRNDDAAQDFARALELAPKDGIALSGLALLQRAQGDVPKAIETMKQAASADELAPNSGEYAYMAARMTLDQGDRGGARTQFESVLRQYPDSVGAANDLAFLLAEDATDLALAQKYAERAVRLQPSPETLDTLGFVKLRRGATEEALGMFERALARQPHYATARYHMALALIEKGEPVAARRALEEALAREFPEQQEARKVLARIDSAEVRP